MKIRIFAFLLLFAFLASTGRAQTGISGLALEVGGQAAGMGEAYSAVTSTPMALYWNPAGLNQVSDVQIAMAHNQWILNIKSDFVAIAWPVRNIHVGTFVSLTNVGGIEYREGPSQNPLATVGETSFVTGVGASKTALSWLDVGIAVKYLYYKVFINQSWGMALDAGAQVRTPVQGLIAAAVIQNLGKMTPIYNEKMKLPQQMRLGVAYRVPGKILNGNWIFASDYFIGFSSKNHLNFGIECKLFNQLSLRAGYQTNYEIKSWHAGAGFRGHNWQIDYGFVPLNLGLDPGHRVSLIFYL